MKSNTCYLMAFFGHLICPWYWCAWLGQDTAFQMPVQALISEENYLCFLFKMAEKQATSFPWCCEQADTPHSLAGLTGWGSAFVKYRVNVPFPAPPAFCEQQPWFWPSSTSLGLTCFASAGRKVCSSLENWCLIAVPLVSKRCFSHWSNSPQKLYQTVCLL